MPTNRGSLKLFEIRGIEVFVHWSWLLVAVLEIQLRRARYASLGWNIAAYLSLFAIVLLHEFGHAFACRSIGGKADRIVLWPLGGVAYVLPPPRPGALLWSIAAGPLVNLVLFVPSLLAWYWTRDVVSPELSNYLLALAAINAGLFVFNCLPVYPLDGGQMLRAVLWFFVGRAKSLYYASYSGILGAIAFAGIGVFTGNIPILIIAAFSALRSWSAIRGARALEVLLAAPVHRDAACPSCGESPPQGLFWRCVCGAGMDVFQLPLCMNCNQLTLSPACPHCGQSHPVGEWQRAV